MFPLHDDNPRIGMPWATLGLIAANALVWFFVEALGFHKAVSHSICEFGMISGELLQRATPGTHFQLTADTICVLGDTPNWRTVFSSMFIHGGWFHLISNLWFLWVFGKNVESGMGSIRYLLFYFVAGATAAAIHIASNPESTIPAVGASGAIGAVMGAYLVLYPKVGVHLWIVFTRIVVPAYSMMAFWLFVQVVTFFTSIGQPGDMPFWLHVGGFVAGLGFVFLFRNKALVDRHPYHGWA
jgi:membrane associated rhomboid family serine protease